MVTMARTHRLDKRLSLPPADVLMRVVSCFKSEGIPFALGGSALLASMGIVDIVHDWDVTTDCSAARVFGALSAADIDFVEAAGPDELFASAAHVAVGGESGFVDLIIGFAVRIDQSVVRIPAHPKSTWMGLPVADPLAWQIAYRAMGRHGSADAIGAVLEGRSA